MGRYFILPVSAFLLFLMMPVTSLLAQQATDTVTAGVPKHRKMTKKEINEIWIAPTALFAASALTWGEREAIREFRNRYVPAFENHYDDYLQYVPLALVVGLNAAGIKGKHKPNRALVSYVFSAAIMATLVNSIKYTAKVERPDGSAKNSFPSGHSANSFMNATILHKEYGQYRHPLYSVLGYTLATGTAVGRGLNNRHWISDVLAGAGIGILSAQLGYLVTDKIFKDHGINDPLKPAPYPVNARPSYLEARLGFALATTKDLLRATDLEARHGYNIGLEGAWFFSKHVGVGGEFAFSTFPINSSRLYLNDPIYQEIGEDIYTEPMGVRYLNIGPYFSLPMTNGWFITAKANAGISAGARGSVVLNLKPEYVDEFNGNPELTLMYYQPEHAFAWSAGAGIQKRVSRNIALKAYTSYFDSDHDFAVDEIDDVDDDGNYTYKRVSTERVRFNHFTFGIAVTAFIW